LSPATCQSCKDQNAALELRRTYDFLTRLRDEFEPLCAQLLARHPCVSPMDALAEIRNEETRLQDASLLWVSSVLAARSSVPRPATPATSASPSVALSAAHGVSIGRHCDHCGQDGHVEAFCYRKKKAQAHRSSQGTGGFSSGGSERSSNSSEAHELLMLLRHLAASTSPGAVGSVTQSSALTGSATASQSFTLGLPSAPSSGTYSWYLDSGDSFYMTHHSTHLSSLHPSYRHCIVHTADGSPLSVAG
jgi:hypothetical protein